MITIERYHTSIVTDLGFEVVRSTVADNTTTLTVLSPAVDNDGVHSPASSVTIGSIRSTARMLDHCRSVLDELKRRNTAPDGVCRILHRGDTIYNYNGKCICCGETFKP
jgi:hypothetical protein